MLRLSDVLGEQSGLTLTDGVGGTGVQLQGFGSAYTLILVDGEPVIGREGGTLDLARLPVADVERIEIVRGPTSARYGSDALAGVINIITQRPEAELGGEVSARYGRFGTSDFSVMGHGGGSDWSVRMSGNRYASNGYDLFPNQPGATSPAFIDYSTEVRVDGRPGDRFTLELLARAAHLEQDGGIFLNGGVFDERAVRDEWSVAPRLRARLSSQFHLETRLYIAYFRNETIIDGLGGDIEVEGLEHTAFEQTLTKAEATLSYLPSVRIAVHAGGGILRESVSSDRYTSGQKAHQGFAFGEWAWMPSRVFDLNLSTRFDLHSAYAARFTPKVAALVRLSENIRLRASVGSGFRAPDFRQRYLNFSNAAAGYTVLGSEELAAGLAKLDAAGGIDRYLIDTGALEPIKAESSVAFGAGVEVEPFDNLTARINLFYNDVHDLIETQPVAVKTNGQQVFSYFNLARIYTRGLDAEVRWNPLDALGLSVTYQYLDTADRAVLEAIEAGTLFGRNADGRDVLLSRSDYGGLLGRSRHSGTLRLTGRLPGSGFNASARLIWRGRYGDRDVNGNVVLDDDREYVNGYALLNLTLSQTIQDATLQAGVRNLLDFKRPEQLPTQPGRTVFGGFSYRF